MTTITSQDGTDTTWPRVGNTLGRNFMLRIAGLPIEAVHGLRFDATARWADTVVAEERRLLDRGAHISELLHELVGGLADDQARRRLVNLRRDIFHGKLPRDLDTVDRCLASAAPETVLEVESWLRDRQELDRLLGSGAQVFRADAERARASLRELAVDPRLRQGLLLASPVLDRYVDNYVVADHSRLSKRQRRIERSLLEYVYRAACKASPFSTFTGVALGAFTDEPADAGLSVAVDEVWSSRPRVNVAILGRLATLIINNPRLRADLPVELTSGWVLDTDRIRYVRREVSEGDDDATVSFDAVRESLFFLRNSGTLKRMIDVFGRRPSLSYGELVTELVDGGDATATDYDRYLKILLDLGLLRVPALQIDIHSDNPMRAFRDALAGMGVPWAAETAARLDQPLAVLARYAAADVAGRRRILDELRESFAALAREFGGDSTALPRTLVFEDCAASRHTATLGRASWETFAGGSLRELAGVLPAFDLTLPHRLTLRGFFLARYGVGGRCDDVLSLVQDFHEDIYDQYVRISSRRRPFDADGRYVRQENWLGIEEIEAIDRVRERFAAAVRRLWRESEGRDSIELDRALVKDLAAELDKAQPRFSPRSFFTQLAGTADDPLAVLNHSYGGLSFCFSRFTHCFDDPGSQAVAHRIRDSLREVEPGDAVFAEITGGFSTTNLNLHPRLTEFEIVCPGETSSVPEPCRIPLEDLYAEHDAASNRLVLRSRRLEREVIPVYLGYLVPMALPEIPRTLLLFSPNSAASIDVWGGMPDPTDDTVVVRPRVRYGSVVLSRASWSLPSRTMPARESGLSDEQWYLAWRRWKLRHGLPDRAYATIQEPDAEGDDGWKRLGKPLYVDFDSFLSLTVLDALVKTDTSRIVLHEALPDEASPDRWGPRVRSSDGARVCEFAVEMTASSVPLGVALPTETTRDGEVR